jgi:thiamine pyrophosphate-dependent acetolactate synthase large subunit-like protein
MGRERHPAPVVAALSATAGLVPDLKNPDFGAVAMAMGLWAHSISKAGELEESVQTWLANPVRRCCVWR